MSNHRPRPVVVTPDWLVDVPLGHRGLHDDDRPPNSLAAFAAARDAGVGIELDVRLSSDGVPVVVHDATVTIDDRQVAVDTLTVDQLTAEGVAGRDEGIATLDEALRVAGDAPVMVEVKNEGTHVGPLEAATAAVLATHDDRGGGPTCVASFNPRTLRWLRRRRPAVDRVLTVSPSVDPDLPFGLRWSANGVRLLRLLSPVAVSHDLHELSTASVQAHRREGGIVVTWTVTDEDELSVAREHADNLIFEQVTVEEVTGSAG